MTLTSELIQDLSPIYVTTNQKRVFYFFATGDVARNPRQRKRRLSRRSFVAMALCQR